MAKDIRTTIIATIFYGVQKSLPFLPCCVAAEKSALLLKLVKNRGFESCSNISFPLGTWIQNIESIGNFRIDTNL